MTGSTRAVLAMEVSQRNGGIALRVDAGPVLMQRLTSSTRRGDALMPAVESLCSEAGVTPGAITGLGVTIGPGGFTGLRIGIAAAKMLGWALGVPIVAVPTALVAAESDTAAESPLAVALSAKDHTCWLSLVEGPPGNRTLAAGEEGGRLVDTAAFLEGVASASCLLADSHLPDSMMDHGLDCREPDFHPEALMLITERMLAAGDVIDPLELAPIYPRDPEAVRLWGAKGC